DQEVLALRDDGVGQEGRRKQRRQAARRANGHGPENVAVGRRVRRDFTRCVGHCVSVKRTAGLTNVGELAVDQVKYAWSIDRPSKPAGRLGGNWNLATALPVASSEPSEPCSGAVFGCWAVNMV